MLCLACRRFSVEAVCPTCRRSLRPAPERVVADGIRVVAAYVHEGAAQQLIHDLKYRGVLGYADMAAGVLAGRVPPLPLVPVPRVLTRRLRYGVDPSRELAESLSALTGGQVIHLLTAPWHSPRRAGGDHAAPPRFGVVGRPPPRLVIVDDVVTTGGTIGAAAAALGPERVELGVAANSARKRGV